MISKTNKLDFLLSESATILDAISLINSGSYLIAIIVNKNNQLMGSITDGDIRRGLLNGLSLDSPCIGIMNTRPQFSSMEDSYEERLQIMQINEIKQLPIVDKNKTVQGLLFYGQKESLIDLPNKMLIMAGGFGTRMHPLTTDLPKPMLKLGEKPILEHIILRAKRYGIKNFYISLHYLGEVIQSYFKDGSSLGVNIEYLHEVNPLGTAGAISLIKEDFKDPLLITNGDLYIDLNYKNLVEFHLSNCADATMAIRKHVVENPFGVVETDDLEICAIKEKPKYESNVNAGIYIISQRIKKLIKADTYVDMPDLLQSAIQQNNKFKVVAYPLHEEWMDIGKPSDLMIANSAQDE
jgi:dTDP-glucose pyrophosphorylase/CBS domain-containing protein